jgi:hypothetical protein
MIVPHNHNTRRLRRQGVATPYDLSANLRNIKQQRGPRGPSNFQERPLAEIDHSFRPRSSSTPHPSPPKPLFDLRDYITPEPSEGEEVQNELSLNQQNIVNGIEINKQNIDNENNESYFAFPSAAPLEYLVTKIIAEANRNLAPSAPAAFLFGDTTTTEKPPLPNSSSTLPRTFKSQPSQQQWEKLGFTRDPLPLSKPPSYNNLYRPVQSSFALNSSKRQYKPTPATPSTSLFTSITKGIQTLKNKSFRSKSKPLSDFHHIPEESYSSRQSSPSIASPSSIKLHPVPVKSTQFVLKQPTLNASCLNTGA